MEFAFVDMVRMLDESDRGKALSAKLQEMAGHWQKKAAALETRSERLNKQQASNAPSTKTPDAEFNIQRERQMIDMEMRQLEEAMRFDLESRREHFRAALLDELKPLLATFAKEKNIAAIFAVSGQDVLYSDPKNDLTEGVMRRFNALTSKASATAH